MYPCFKIEIKALKSKCNFVHFSKEEEEEEHSLEMHMPYIYKVFGDSAKIVPIIVGENNMKMAEEYGKLFSPYFDKEDTIFIISSDFCHWGAHFDFQPRSADKGVPIWKFIEDLDHQGMKLIEQNDIAGFDSYMKSTGNTICGEQPIRLLMNTIKQSKLGTKTEFVRYAQSEKATSNNSSSVSYASSVSFIGLE
jgi:AmmeMemoRadiSam system protein B